MKKTDKISRRCLIGAGVMTGLGTTLAKAEDQVPARMPTPPHIEGPFYPITPQTDKDADLTRLGDSAEIAKGEIIIVEGQVLSDDGAPIPEAVVDIWQANAAGRYAHERDPNPAPLDPHFQGWAILKTDGEGRYRFKTVKPGAYPISARWTRPPHIHFKVSRRGFHEITTQMYFEGEPLNDGDRLLNQLEEARRPALIATRKGETSPFRFDVVLKKV